MRKFCEKKYGREIINYDLIKLLAGPWEQIIPQVFIAQIIVAATTTIVFTDFFSRKLFSHY